jgi:sporulation protein YlmC with PRC-barrel domain
MGPSRQRADQDQDQNDDENGPEHLNSAEMWSTFQENAKSPYWFRASALPCTICTAPSAKRLQHVENGRAGDQFALLKQAIIRRFLCRRLAMEFQPWEPLKTTCRCSRRTSFARRNPMTKLSAAVVFAAIAAAAMPAAFAQTHTTSDSPAPVSDTAPALSIQPDQVRASKMIGNSVYDVQNRDIGSVKDLVLDRDGRVAEVVVDVGSFLGIGGKYVAVPPSDITTDNNRLTLDRTKEQLQQMAEYHLQNQSTGAGTTPSPVTGGQLGHRTE